MCGFVGFTTVDYDKATNEAIVQDMADRIKHRGPDEDGYFVNDHIAMGFRRLSIIDLAQSHQPMKNQEGDVIVTSGFGGVFPKGLVVGIVSQLKIDTGGLLQVAILEPAVDFQKLEDVMVITASREAPPEPFQTPEQTPGTETDPAQEAKEAAQQAAAQQEAAQSGGQQVEAGQP